MRQILKKITILTLQCILFSTCGRNNPSLNNKSTSQQVKETEKSEQSTHQEAPVTKVEEIIKCNSSINSEVQETTLVLDKMTVYLKDIENQVDAFKQATQGDNYSSIVKTWKDKITGNTKKIDNLTTLRDNIFTVYEKLKFNFEESRYRCFNLKNFMINSDKTCYIDQESSLTSFVNEQCNLKDEVMQFNQLITASRSLLDENNLSMIPNYFKWDEEFHYEDLNKELDFKEGEPDFNIVLNETQCYELANIATKVIDQNYSINRDIEKINNIMNTKDKVTKRKRDELRNEQSYLNSHHISFKINCNYLEEITNTSYNYQTCFSKSGNEKIESILTKKCDAYSEINKLAQKALGQKLPDEETPEVTIKEQKPSIKAPVKKSKTKAVDPCPQIQYPYAFINSWTLQAQDSLKKIREGRTLLRSESTIKEEVKSQYISNINNYIDRLSLIENECEDLNKNHAQCLRKDHSQFCSLEAYQKIKKEEIFKFRIEPSFDPTRKSYEEINDKFNANIQKLHDTSLYAYEISKDQSEPDKTVPKKFISDYNKQFLPTLKQAQKACEKYKSDLILYDLSFDGKQQKTPLFAICSTLNYNKKLAKLIDTVELINLELK